jgi:hypothetical protein
MNPLRYAFRELMPVMAVENPTGEHRRTYRGITYVLLNKCYVMQLHPAEALVLLHCVLNSDYYGGAPADFWDHTQVRMIVFRGLVLREWMHEHSTLFSVDDLRGCFNYLYSEHQLRTSYIYQDAPDRVRYGARSYAVLFEDPDSLMAFLSVYCPPLRQERPEIASGENAHPLCPPSTVWGGRSWSSAIPLSANWRYGMQDFVRQCANVYTTYDYGQLELF